MKRLLAALLISLALPAFAAEALVSSTATRMDPTPWKLRRAVEIQNLGPNPIFCQLRNSTNLAVNKGRQVINGEPWAFAAGAATQIWCISSSSQVTGAASIVTEVE